MVEINPISFDTQPAVQQNPLLDPRLQQLLAQQQAKTLSQALLAQATAQTPVYSARAGLAKMLTGGLAGVSEGMDLKKAAEQQAAMGKVRGYATGLLGGGDLPPGAAPATGKENDEDPPEAPATAAPTSDDDTPGPQASAVDPDAENRFIGTLKAGGLTNPNGLAAVAAYGNAESGYDPKHITGSWSDPSESGEPGTSGGTMSWRGPRFKAMQAATAGAADPVVAQAQFMLKENPQLTAALQNAKSPEEAHSLMANAWQFAGYDRPGGENARRMALTRQYLGKVGGAQTAQADGDQIPNPNGYDTSLLPAGVQPGTGAGPQTADANPAPTDATPSPNAVTGGGPQPGQLASALRQGLQPGQAGPNGGVMSAPTNRGASMEMLPLEQGGGYAPAPPPRPQAQQMAAALQGGSPLSAAQGKLAYAGNGPVMSDAPPPGVSPGLTPPPPGFQPQGPQEGPAPQKEAATRTLVGPSPVINDGQPVLDPQANPATGAPTVLKKGGAEPPGIANAGRKQPVDAGQAVAQANAQMQAQKAQQLQAAAVLGQSGNAADKELAAQLVKRATSQQTGMYAWNGGIMYKDQNGAPQWFLRPSEMNGSWKETTINGVPHLYNSDSANPRSTLVPLVDPKSVAAQDLTQPTMLDKDGNKVMNPNYVSRKPGEAATAPFRSGVNVSNTNTVGGEQTEFSKNLDKERSKAASEIEAAGRNSSGQIQRLNILRTMLDGASTGALANAHASIVGMAQAVGVSNERLAALGFNPNQAISAQAAQKITNELVTASIGHGGFPANNFSDADREFLTKMFPQLSNRPEANKLALDIMVKVEERKQQVADAWSDYQSQMEDQGKPVSFNKFEREIGRALRGQDMFADVRKEVEALGIKAEAGSGGNDLKEVVIDGIKITPRRK